MTEQERSRRGPAVIRSPWALVAGVLCAGAMASLWLFGVAGAQSGSTVGDAAEAIDHVTVLTSQGRFTGPGEWPPAPHEARGPMIQAARPTDTDRGQVVARLESHSEVQAQLGVAYSLISSTNPLSDRAGAAKGELNLAQLETTWFSRSTNQTVIALSDAEGAQVTDLRMVPAGDAQPDLTDDEDALAITLARTFWADEGDKRIDDLEGFSIWAFREDGRVYDVRMAYVSFHRSREHDPELITWVDLTNETVVRSEVVR